MKRIYNTGHTKKVCLPLAITIKRISLLIIFLSGNLLIGQNVNYDWAKAFGGTDYNKASSIVDEFGNIYTTGYFDSTLDFDLGVGVYNLTSNGERDIYISKLDASGNFVWAKNIGGPEFDEGEAITIDEVGNIYVTGHFTDTVDFDAGVGTTELTAGFNDIFVSKLDPSGNLIWAKKFTGTGYDEVSAIDVDEDGNVFIAGFFGDTLSFGPGVGTNDLIVNGPNDLTDGFVAKLDPLGNFLWSKKIGGAGFDQTNSISTDANGNVYATGFFSDTTDFDPGPGVNNIVANGHDDIFVLKLDALGNYLWSNNFGGTGQDRGTSIKVDEAGNVFYTGIFAYTVDFDPGGGFDLVSSNSKEIFVSKLDPLGNLVWAKSFVGTGDGDKSFALNLDYQGNIYTTGYFSNTVDFDPGIGVTNLTAINGLHAFVSKLDPSGDFVWAKNFGGTILYESTKGESINIDGTGAVYITGLFSATIDLDPGIGTHIVTSNGRSDVFILKLGCVTSGTHVVTACDSYDFNGTTYTSDNFTAKDTLTNIAGCDSIVTLNLTISEVSTSTTHAGNTIYSSTTGATYQWINCADSSAIPNATSSSYTATVNGDYAVSVTVGGCSAISACISVVVTGINNPIKTNVFQLFPNPTSSSVTITDFDFSIDNISIVDVTGKLVKSFTPVSAMFDITTLQRGVYFVKIRHNDEIVTRKIVKR